MEKSELDALVKMITPLISAQISSLKEELKEAAEPEEKEVEKTVAEMSAREFEDSLRKAFSAGVTTAVTTPYEVEESESGFRLSVRKPDEMFSIPKKNAHYSEDKKGDWYQMTESQVGGLENWALAGKVLAGIAIGAVTIGGIVWLVGKLASGETVSVNQSNGETIPGDIRDNVVGLE